MARRGRPAARREGASWVWPVATGLLLAIAAILLARILLFGVPPLAARLATGRSAIVTLNSGQVEGGLALPPFVAPVSKPVPAPLAGATSSPPMGVQEAAKIEAGPNVAASKPEEAMGASRRAPEVVLHGALAPAAPVPDVRVQPLPAAAAAAASRKEAEVAPAPTRHFASKTAASVAIAPEPSVALPGPAPHTLIASSPARPIATPPLQRDGGLAPAPYAPIAETTEKGVVPLAARDGTLAWRYYGRPYADAAKKPLLAVVIGGLGLSKSQTEAAFTLPPDITLSFSPYAGDAKQWAEKARGKGFETLLDIPLEPKNYPFSDPGPYGLLENLPSEESQSRLQWILSRVLGYVGLMAPINEKFTENVTALRGLVTGLTGRGVLFVYVKTPQNAPLLAMNADHHLLMLGIDQIIDDDMAPAAIDAQFAKLIALAKSQGSALGLARAYPPTLEALSHLQETLQKEGVELVPLSAVARRALP